MRREGGTNETLSLARDLQAEVRAKIPCKFRALANDGSPFQPCHSGPSNAQTKPHSAALCFPLRSSGTSIWWKFCADFDSSV